MDKRLLLVLLLGFIVIVSSSISSSQVILNEEDVIDLRNPFVINVNTGGTGGADGNASSICSGDEVLLGNGTCLSSATLAANGSGDITAVNTDGPYLSGGATSGAVSLLLNETFLNTTIDARASAAINIFDQELNQSQNVTFAILNLTEGVGTDLTPIADSTWSLGTIALKWLNGFFDGLFVDNLNATNINATVIRIAGTDVVAGPHTASTNIFDQDLNTTNNVTFSGINITNSTGALSLFIGANGLIGIRTANPTAILHITPTPINGTQHAIEVTPTDALVTDAEWHGIHIETPLLDPTGTGTEIVGIEIDLSGVNVTNDPVMHGIEINVPVRKDAMHIDEGQLVINNLPDNISTTEFHALDVRVNLLNLSNTSAWAAMSITAVGDTDGEVDGILVRNLVGAIRQEVGDFTTPSQTEFAGRKTGGGSTWVDGLDTENIFVVNNDEIYIGAAAQFSQIEVIMGAIATKDVLPTFHYSIGADTWTEFFPDDETNGFQGSSLISWVPDSISDLWTGDGDPGAGDTTAGFWIKIIRERQGNIGSPSITTMKTGTVTTFTWDKSGDLLINNLNATGNITALFYRGGW